MFQWEYTYNQVGNPVFHPGKRGKTTRYSCDANGNMTKVTRPSAIGEAQIKYSYGAYGGTVSGPISNFNAFLKHLDFICVLPMRR